MANIARLIKLAEALESPLPKKLRKSGRHYDQNRFVHPCGTPACALGYYARKSEGRFELKKVSYQDNAWHLIHKNYDMNIMSGAKEEFDITLPEATELFGGTGCGNARNRKQAAQYVRDFISRKLAEQDEYLFTP
jgi:hypothetical protein